MCNVFLKYYHFFPKYDHADCPPSSTIRITGKMFYPAFHPTKLSVVLHLNGNGTARPSLKGRMFIYTIFLRISTFCLPTRAWKVNLQLFGANQPTTHHLWRGRVLRQVRQSSSGHVRPIPCGKRVSGWTCPSLAKDQPEEEEEVGEVWHVYGVNSTHLGTLHGPVIAWIEGGMLGFETVDDSKIYWEIDCGIGDGLRFKFGIL